MRHERNWGKRGGVKGNLSDSGTLLRGLGGGGRGVMGWYRKGKMGEGGGRPWSKVISFVFRIFNGSWLKLGGENRGGSAKKEEESWYFRREGEQRRGGSALFF